MDIIREDESVNNTNKNVKSKQFIQNQKNLEIKKNIENCLSEKIPELNNIEGGFHNIKVASQEEQNDF